MKILNKVSLKNLKLNRKRTVSTVIGIILSTALICAACTLATSFQATLVQNAINETGYYTASAIGVAYGCSVSAGHGISIDSEYDIDSQ